MITAQDLLNQREQIQHDIDCILDGADGGLLTAIDDVVVDRFRILLGKLEKK